MSDEKINIRNKKITFYFLMFFLALIAIVLIYLPANFFDSGQSICLSVLLFDKQCFGCGMTRAIQHLIHLDFEIAFQYNKLSFIVFPLFVTMIFIELRKMYKFIYNKTA